MIVPWVNQLLLVTMLQVTCRVYVQLEKNESQLVDDKISSLLTATAIQGIWCWMNSFEIWSQVPCWGGTSSSFSTTEEIKWSEARHFQSLNREVVQETAWKEGRAVDEGSGKLGDFGPVTSPPRDDLSPLQSKSSNTPRVFLWGWHGRVFQAIEYQRLVLDLYYWERGLRFS